MEGKLTPEQYEAIFGEAPTQPPTPTPTGQGAQERDADLDRLCVHHSPYPLSAERLRTLLMQRDEAIRLARAARDDRDTLAVEMETDEIEIIDLNNGYDQLITRIAKLEADRAALAADVLELRACLRDLLDAQQFEGLGYGDREEGGPNAQGWIAATAAAEARLAGAAGAEGE